MGGRGASSSGGGGGTPSTGNAQYNSFLKNTANLTKPSDLKVGDKVISRLVTKDGKRKLDTWKATGDDSIIGKFEPQNDIRVTKITKSPKTVKVEGIVNNNSGKGISVVKTFSADSDVFTRK